MIGKLSSSACHYRYPYHYHDNGKDPPHTPLLLLARERSLVFLIQFDIQIPARTAGSLSRLPSRYSLLSPSLFFHLLHLSLVLLWSPDAHAFVFKGHAIAKVSCLQDNKVAAIFRILGVVEDLNG